MPKRETLLQSRDLIVIYTYGRNEKTRSAMNIANVAVEPLLALLVGILILLVPRFLNYFVAVYLIVVGVLGLTHHSF